MKKILIAVPLLMVCSTAFADTSKFEGFDVALGAEYVKPDLNYNDTYPETWSKADTLLKIDAGYNYPLSENWLLGVGLTYDLTNLKSREYSDHDKININAKMKKHISGYTQLTYTITNSSAVFAKLSYHSADFTYGPTVENVWDEDKYHTNGFGYGLGYKMFLTDHLFAQAEVNIVNYKKHHIADYNYTGKTKSAILSIGYHF